jgi:hypothetical protein
MNAPMRRTMLAVVALLVSCGGVREGVFRPKGSITPRLLPLQVHVADMNVFRGEVSQGGEMLSQWNRDVTQDRADEARYLIKRDLYENVFAPGEKPVGHIVLKISRTQGLQQWWAIPTAFTLTAINLVGFPYNGYTTKVTVDARILDRNQVELARYTVTGKSTAYIAMYWGYSPAASVQVSAADSTRIAMKNLKVQLQADAAGLNTRLSHGRSGAGR